MDRLKLIESRKLEIRTILESGSECDLEALKIEFLSLE